MICLVKKNKHESVDNNDIEDDKDIYYADNIDENVMMLTFDTESSEVDENVINIYENKVLKQIDAVFVIQILFSHLLA